MIVRDATDDDIRHVVLNMRELNRREICGLRGNELAEPLAIQIIGLRPFALLQQAVCLDCDVPAMLMGLYELTPTVVLAQMIATDEWPAIGMPAYRLMRRTMKDVLRNVRRAECIVLEANGSRAWMERLGFVEEARHRQRGKHGETYVTMAWINPEFADAADRG